VQIADRCAPWKISSGAEKLVFQALQFLSAAKSQAGQAQVITDLISALWRVTLVLELKRLISIRE
jgi:hypothetical protein